MKFDLVIALAVEVVNDFRREYGGVDIVGGTSHVLIGAESKHHFAVFNLLVGEEFLYQMNGDGASAFVVGS